MKFVRINPPGTFCVLEALRDAMARCGGKSFLDVGCGSGSMSKVLLDAGLNGTGVDFSESALELAEKKLKRYVEAGNYSVRRADIFDLPDDAFKVDLVISYMVMEHIEDDKSFLQKLLKFLNTGGHVIIAVPGRRDRWSIEDETVGHFRRYERHDLQRILEETGFRDPAVWSVSVPVSNMLFNVGTALLRRSEESKKVNLTRREQTEASGIQDIPWKTTFPSVARLVLNRWFLYPLFIIQRMFYRTSLGLTLLGIAQK